MQYLTDLHQFVYQHLGDELLWATSMPCELRDDAEVPIARYGSSYQGRVKYIYRHGLLIRYGGIMQAISGVHFNYSLPEAFWPLYAEICQLTRQRPEFRLGALLRPAAQLPPARLDRVVSVWRLAGAVPLVPAGAQRRSLEPLAHETHADRSAMRPRCA